MSPRSLAAIALLVLVGAGGVAVALGSGGPSRVPGRKAAASVATPANRTAAATPVGPIAPNTSIPGDSTSGLAQDSAGDFLTAIVNYTPSGRLSTALARVPKVGGRAIVTPITRRPTGAARVSGAQASVSAAGAVAATSRRPGGPASQSAEYVTTVRPDGSRVSEQKVPGLTSGASPYVIAMGPTGAVALASTEKVGRISQVVFSFRPAGAARFGTPVTLPYASVPSADGTLNSDLIGSELSLVMSPNGGAAIIDGPASGVRLVTPAGAVSDQHRLDHRPTSLTVAAFRDDGTLVAATTRAIEEKRTTIDDEYYASKISIAEWSPTAAEPTVRALPLHPGEVEANDDFTLSLGPAGRTILVLADGENHLEVLSGTGTAIESIGHVPASRAYDAHAFPTADGGTALIWSPDGSTGDTALLTAAAPPGGTLGAVHPIRAVTGNIEIESILPLPDGRVAMAYDGSVSDANLLIAQP